MKIAIVLPPSFRFSTSQPNSIENVVRTLATHSRFRDTLRVVCDASDHDTGDIATIPVDPSGGRWARTKRVIAALAGWSPDIIELHQHAPTAGKIARALDRVPAYFYRHNFLKEPKGFFRRLRHAARYSAFDAHVFVSNAAREPFLRAFPRYADRTHVIQNAIDVSEWAAPVAGRDPLIAYVGRATPEKGFGELCAALAKVLPTHPQWRAIFVTNESASQFDWAQQQLAQLSRYAGQLTLLTDQPTAVVRDTLRQASIAVVPSRWNEPFGLSALEAHAAGAAVISSGTGGLREVSGEHALYLSAVTPGAVAEAIDQLIRDADRRVALAESGQRFVARTHDAHDRAAELDDFRERLRDRVTGG